MARAKPDGGAAADALLQRLAQAAADAAHPEEVASPPREEAPQAGRAVGSDELRRRYDATREIPLALLDVDEVQVREKMKNVDGLARSMRRGQWHPVIVTVTPDGRRFHLETGARRVAAARVNEWATIYAAVTDEMSEIERLLLQLEENTQRDQLTGEEKRKVYLQVREKLGKGIRGTKEAAALLGINERSFRRVIREREEGEVWGGLRLSTGQISRHMERLAEGASKVPVAKLPGLLETAKKVVEALEEAINQAAQASTAATESADFLRTPE